MWIQGELEKGMAKDPIAIEPAYDLNEGMLPSSRLRFGKTYTIECNVKVRDIGMVALEHRSLLLSYWHDEKDKGFEADEPQDHSPQNAHPSASNSGCPPSSQGAQGPSYQGGQDYNQGGHNFYQADPNSYQRSQGSYQGAQGSYQGGQGSYQGGQGSYHGYHGHHGHHGGQWYSGQ